MEIIINTKRDLENLIDKIKNEKIAECFKFKSLDLKCMFLEKMQIVISEDEESWWFIDKKKKLHIAESVRGHMWISNIGLIADKSYIFVGEKNNKFIRMFFSQYKVNKILHEKLISLTEKEDVYDIDSITFNNIQELAPAIFHNMIFYYELFAKAYLSFNNKQVPKHHNLKKLYKRIIITMFEKKQNDTIFHLNIVSKFRGIVEYILKIDGFREHYAKYDDNINDKTIIPLEINILKKELNAMEVIFDFISDLSYTGSKTFYLKQGCYKKGIDFYKDNADLEKIKEDKSFLIINELNSI